MYVIKFKHKVYPIATSYGTTLPKEIVEAIRIGEYVWVKVKDGKVLVSKEPIEGFMPRKVIRRNGTTCITLPRSFIRKLKKNQVYIYLEDKYIVIEAN